jgi:hypothetical protein
MLGDDVFAPGDGCTEPVCSVGIETWNGGSPSRRRDWSHRALGLGEDDGQLHAGLPRVVLTMGEPVFDALDRTGPPGCVRLRASDCPARRHSSPERSLCGVQGHDTGLTRAGIISFYR